jgi:hypothetical protein
MSSTPLTLRWAEQVRWTVVASGENTDLIRVHIEGRNPVDIQSGESRTIDFLFVPGEPGDVPRTPRVHFLSAGLLQEFELQDEVPL